jgi:hypothetical protein
MPHVLRRASLLAVLIALPTLALAGPPLICHPFDIGTARSLPIGPADGGWSAIDPAYDRSRLVTDTIALLTPSTPTLVRMETLRRATMYVADDAAAAGRLLQALRARTSKAPPTRAEAIALFDVGYLVEAYRQLGAHKRALATAAGELDGYNLVTAALRVVQDDPALHFAAALMTVDGKHVTAHRAHAQQARAASGDPLLARNLRTHLREA